MASRNHSSSSYASSEEVQQQRQEDSNEQTPLDYNSNVSLMSFDSDDEMFDQYTVNNFLQILLHGHMNHGSPTGQNLGQESSDAWRSTDKVQVEQFQGGLGKQWSQSSLNQEKRILSDGQCFQQQPRATYSQAECKGSGQQMQIRDTQSFKQCSFQQESEVLSMEHQEKSNVYIQGDQRAKSQQHQAALSKQWQQCLFQKETELPTCEQPFQQDLTNVPPQKQQQKEFIQGEGKARNEWKQCIFADHASQEIQQRSHQGDINISSHAEQTLMGQRDLGNSKQQWSHSSSREMSETPAVPLQGNVADEDKHTYQDIHELSERIDEFLQTWQFLEGQPPTANTTLDQTSLEQDSNNAWQQQFQQIPGQMLPSSEAQQQSVKFLDQQTPTFTWQHPQHQLQPYVFQQQEIPWSQPQSAWSQGSGMNWLQQTPEYSTDVNKVSARQTNRLQAQGGTGYFDRRLSGMHHGINQLEQQLNWEPTYGEQAGQQDYTNIEAMYEDQGRRLSGSLLDTSDQIRQFEETVIKKRKLTETTQALKTELRSKSEKMRTGKERIRLHVLNRSKSLEKKLDVERKYKADSL